MLDGLFCSEAADFNMFDVHMAKGPSIFSNIDSLQAGDTSRALTPAGYSRNGVLLGITCKFRMQVSPNCEASGEGVHVTLRSKDNNFRLKVIGKLSCFSLLLLINLDI